MADDMRRRTLTLDKARTSVRLEPPFWVYLDEAAKLRGLPKRGGWSSLVASIAAAPPKGAADSVASAVRVWCLMDALVRVAREADHGRD